MTTQHLTTDSTVASLAPDVLSWVQELLEDSSIESGQNFLDVGGHSLVATRLNKLLKEKYGMKIPLKNLFEDSIAEACRAAVPA